jgi:hypothetical protein
MKILGYLALLAGGVILYLAATGKTLGQVFQIGGKTNG